MSYKISLFFLAIIMLGTTIAAYNYLPPEIPIHYNLQGEPDNWGPKGTIFLMPLIYLGTILLVPFLLSISPKNFQGSGSKKTIDQFVMAIGLLLLGIHFGTLGRALEWGVNPNVLMSLGFAGFMILGGNIIGRIEKNFFVGIRVPWTLTSDENWRVTHRFAGKLLVATGVVLFFVSYWVETLIWPVAFLLSSLLIPVFYSYYFYVKNEKPKEST